MEKRPIDDIIFRINYFRNKKKLSARQLSLMLGKSSTYIHSLENHVFEPSISTLYNIFDVLDITPEEFFYHDIFAYEVDKKTLAFLSTLSTTQKEAIMNLYNKN